MGERCSGNSRGLKNVALTVDNAAVDQYASEFNAIIEGTDPNQKYHSLSTQIGYHEIEYDSAARKYKLKNASDVQEAPQNPVAISGLTLDEINEIKNFCNARNFGAYPPIVLQTLSATNKDDLLTNDLSHAKWNDNTIPVYDINRSYFTAELYIEYNLDPEEPESFFNFFWPDHHIEHIVKETNEYIDKKYHRNNYYNVQSQPPKHTNPREIKRFMGCVIYM